MDVTAKVELKEKLNRGAQASYWIRLKLEICKVLYFMQRDKDLEEFLVILQSDCEELKDKFFLRKSLEFSARICIRGGKREKGEDLFKKIIDIAETHNHIDLDYISLLGDYGEFLLIERRFERATEVFEKARKLLLSALRITTPKFELQNINEVNNNVKICSDLFENKYDIEQKLGSARIEKGGAKGKPSGAGAVKKPKANDEKKRPDSEVTATSLGPLTESNKVSYDVDLNINEISLNEQKHNNTAEHMNIYDPNIEMMIKINIRIVQALLATNRPDLSSGEYVQIADGLEKVLATVETYLEDVYFLFRKDFFINSSIKACNEYLKGKLKLIKAVAIFFRQQSELIHTHLHVKKSSNVNKIMKHLAIHDISRNKYIIKVPTFTKFLREKFIPIVEEAKDFFIRAMNFLKGEVIFQEFGFNLEEVFYEIAKTNLLLAEFRPRIRYQFVNNDDIRQFGISQKIFLQDQEIYDKIDQEVKNDQNDQEYLLWEAFQYVKRSIEATNCKSNTMLNYSSIEDNGPFADVSTIPEDIRKEIIESSTFLMNVMMVVICRKGNSTVHLKITR